MKIIISTLTLSFLFFTTCICQDLQERKPFILGGSFNISSRVIDNPSDNLYAVPFEINTFTLVDNVKEYKSNSFSLSIYSGKHISPNGVIGILGSYNRFSSNNTPQEISNINLLNSNSESYSAGLFYRQYFNLNSNLRLFAQPSCSLSRVDQNSKSEDIFSINYTYKRISFNSILDLGIQYSMNDHWNILLHLSTVHFQKYSTSYENEERSIKGSNLDLSFNLRETNIGIEHVF